MLGKMRVIYKLLLMLLLTSLLPIAALGYFSFSRARSALEETTTQQLIALRNVKRSQIEGYFAERLGDVKVLSGSPATRQSLADYEQAFGVGGVQGADYAAVDRRHGPYLTEYQKTYGYYDLFLITLKGDVVFTAAKEPDLGTNLVSGPYKDSNLAAAFRKAGRGSGVSGVG